MIHLTPEQRQALWEVSSEGIGRIDHVIQQIRQVNPHAFHTNETLAGRMFHHEPKPYVPLMDS
ncbi:hypothetical protein KNO81_41030 [Paraburkholderia sediminicola]|nr:hypothetical protein [Paraburkholderia sediminicola]